MPTDNGIHPELVVLIEKRTPASGHLDATLSLPAAVQFVDEELAIGRAVILEIGGESWVVRKGKELVDFIRRALGGKKEPAPKVTTLSPMAGGEDVPPAPVSDAERFDRQAEDLMQLPPTPLLLPPRYDGAEPGYPQQVTARQPVYADPRAELRAWQALVEKIGERGARGLIAGGGYAVRSKLWPGVIYVVSPNIIKVINQGIQVSSICVVATDGSPIWDVVLNRINLLEAGVEGEVQVFATGQLQR